MARTKKKNGDDAPPVSNFQHNAAERLNIPDATQAKTGLPSGKKPTYRYSPHLSPKLRFDSTGAWDKVQPVIEKAIAGEKLTAEDAEILRAVAKQGQQPWLEWASKQEQEGRGSFAVDDVVLHVHERVSPKAIIAAVQREDTEMQDFFARPKLNRDQALQYYRHNVDWANRIVLGDSLQVMSSLANRENLAGKIQMIYFDPPYGIKFSSNWQNEVTKRTVGEKEEDVSREPEMIKAYRDTWTLGVHSYLAYLKQRLIVAKDLLKDGSDGSSAGSIFVQISDENLHRVRAVMDEVFGANNFCSMITFRKTASTATSLLAEENDYLLWFSKDRPRIKFRHVLEPKVLAELKSYKYLVSDDASAARSASLEDKTLRKSKDNNWRLAQLSFAVSGDPGKAEERYFSFRSQSYDCGSHRHWKTTNPDGLSRLARAARLIGLGSQLNYIRYFDDASHAPHTNTWADTGSAGFSNSDPKIYVVQTDTEVVKRCMLMTTDPGDLVLDPTCGSGTTAYVAEQWGRRWIVIDSSRIAVALARQRLLTAGFESYKTKDPAAGVDPAAPQNPAHGFFYDTAPHISLKSIAQNRHLDPIFEKHESTIVTALENLDKTLIGLGSGIGSLQSKLLSKLKAKFTADGARAITNADLRRWLLPGADASLLNFGTASQRAKWKEIVPDGPGWQEWEVPFDTDTDWPDSLVSALTEYRDAWKAKIDDVNTCIAENAKQEELVDQPKIITGITRVSGPFSVESVRPEELALGEDGKLFDPTTNQADDIGAANADSYIDLMIGLMLKDGVTFLGNRRAEFASLEKESGKSFHARGRWKGKDDEHDSVAVVIGPQYGPINAPMAVEAIESARGLKDITDLVIAAFSFDAAAQQKAKEMDSPAFRIHLAHIRPDVSPGMRGMLKETPNSQLFTVFGQPDIRILPGGDGEYKVEMNGVCIYNPLTGEISESSSTKVAAWFLDTDYDGRCFCISQAFFPDKTAWEKIAKALGTSVPEGAFQAFTTSWPFKPGKHNRIAVKVIDPRGNEVMAIKTLNA